MEPRINIDITDSCGSKVDNIFDTNGLEPYEIYLNGSKVCMTEKFKELELNNEKLKDLILRCWITMFSMRKIVKPIESSLDSTDVNALDTAIAAIEYDIINSGIIANDKLTINLNRMLTSTMKIN